MIRYEIRRGEGPRHDSPRFRERRDLFHPTKRTKPRIENRAEGQPTIVGYAAVFYDPDNREATEYRIFSDLVERIMPGAFDAAIQEGDDARGLYNHSQLMLLGRRSNDTTRLQVDKTGLLYEIDPPDTRRDVVESIERGDVDGSSFAFLATSEWAARGRVVWAQEKDSDGKTIDVREIHDLELYDVGPVVFPAYTGTTAGMRSETGASAQDLEQLALERAQFRGEVARQLGADDVEASQVMQRARMVHLEQTRRRLNLPALNFER